MAMFRFSNKVFRIISVCLKYETASLSRYWHWLDVDCVFGLAFRKKLFLVFLNLAKFAVGNVRGVTLKVEKHIKKQKAENTLSKLLKENLFKD